MFAIEGAKGVTITYLPEEEADAKDAKRDIEKAGAEALIIPVQLMEEVDCKKVIDQHVKKFGTLDILVNNASKQMYVPAYPGWESERQLTLSSHRECKNLEDIDLGNVHSTFMSNILQMFAVTKFALPHMKRGAAIINTTSVTGYKGSPAMGASHRSHLPLDLLLTEGLSRLFLNQRGNHELYSSARYATCP
jgi:NAD(P)-dependent dehydrogenase (short-subunit alcohol dehydrogenase family)